MLSSISSGGSASTAQLSKMLSKLDTNNDGKIDKAEFVAGKPKGTSDKDAAALFDSLDSSQSGSMSQSDLLSAFQQMGAQMQSTLLQAQESTSAAASSSGGDSDGDHDGSGMFSKLDTNGDGTVSQAEFLAGKPKDVTDAQASALWSKISNGADSVTQDQFTSAMKAAGPPPGGGHGHHHHHDSDGASASASSTTSTSSTSSTASSDPGQLLDQLLSALQSGSASSAQPDASSMFSKLDSNGDGTVSQAEFLAGKPKDVTDTQASALWSKISNGADSVSKDQFVSGMKNAGPPDQSSTATSASDPGQLLDQLLSSQSSSSGSTTATDGLTTAQTDAAQMLDQFMRAVSSYQNTTQQNRFSANSMNLSSILSNSVAA